MDYEQVAMSLGVDPDLKNEITSCIGEFKASLTTEQTAQFDHLENLLLQEQGVLLRQLYDRLTV